MMGKDVNVKSDRFVSINRQCARLGSHEWQISRLITLVKDLPVMEIPLTHLNVYYTYQKLTLRQMVGHMEAARDADLTFPIILDEDGEVMDGRHRIMKAIMNNEKTILAVRFENNPTPCKIND